jgi:hypothetical protein
LTIAGFYGMEISGILLSVLWTPLMTSKMYFFNPQEQFAVACNEIFVQTKETIEEGAYSDSQAIGTKISDAVSLKGVATAMMVLCRVMTIFWLLLFS